MQRRDSTIRRSSVTRDMILISCEVLCLLLACSGCGASDAPALPPLPPARVAAVLQGAGACVAATCTMHFAAEPRGDTASFTYSRCGDDSCPMLRGALTKLGQEKARAIGERLDQLKLEDVYGCPGCADGPTSVATVHHLDGWRSSHSFDPLYPEDLPPPLRDASSLIDAVSEALARCESTDLIQVDPGCAELRKKHESIPTGRP